MPLLDITDPKIIRFLTESYDKESRIRMRWVQLNSKNIEKCASFKTEVKNYTEDDIAKVTLIAGMATTNRDHIESMRYRFRTAVPKDLKGKTKYVISSESIMMPVKDEVKCTLLDSTKNYLKERGKEAPDAKYYFMESINWKYGWKFNESEMKMKGPIYGRVCHTFHNVQSRVGPQPDPYHYRSPNLHSHPCLM